jgi:hypothetical protein
MTDKEKIKLLREALESIACFEYLEMTHPDFWDGHLKEKLIGFLINDTIKSRDTLREVFPRKYKK